MRKIVLGFFVVVSVLTMSFGLTACGGYGIQAQVPYGEAGNMIFMGVNYNERYNISKGVKISVNFAHEKVAEEEVYYSIYAGNEGSYDSVLTLPIDFATSEEYNAKSITSEEIVPGVVAYTCKFPQKAVELTLPNELFQGESGTFRLILASNATDLSGDLCDYVFDYTINGDIITLEHGF